MDKEVGVSSLTSYDLFELAPPCGFGLDAEDFDKGLFPLPRSI